MMTINAMTTATTIMTVLLLLPPLGLGVGFCGFTATMLEDLG